MLVVAARHKRAILACLAGLALVLPARAGSLVDEASGNYLSEPLVTEPAWLQSSAFLESSLFDIPGAVSRPSPQVGFVFTPGISWALFDLVELQLAVPLVLNPDASGDRELDAYRQMKALHPDWPGPDNYDSHPDFDLPGLQLGAKVRLLGRHPQDGLLLAAGVTTNLPVFEQWGTNFTTWKTDNFTTSPLLVYPYLTAALAWGRFSPQLQVGYGLRAQQAVEPQSGYFQRDDSGAVITNIYGDLFFNLALPFALVHERTVPLLELNGTYNPTGGWQLFITPAVTFLPRSSSASLSFACMIPIADAQFRQHEGFRFLVNFRYRLDMLSLGGSNEEDTAGGTEELPPANW